MTAPERIWADQDNLTWVEEYPGETMTRDEVCYIRADVSAARIADLTRQLADAHTALDSYRAAADGLTAQLAEARDKALEAIAAARTQPIHSAYAKYVYGVREGFDRAEAAIRNMKGAAK